MALPFHNTVRSSSMFDEMWIITMNLNAAIVVGDIGKAVSFDGATNKVKLAADGDAILGRLESFEDRQIGKVGAVALKGVFKLPKTATDITPGASVVGAGSGKVKAAPVVTPTTAVALTAAQMAALAALSSNLVVEADETNDTVTIVLR